MNGKKYALRYADELGNENEATITGGQNTLDYIIILTANKCRLLDIRRTR